MPHIFAVGDVIGFPALAATSMDQGRLAAYHAFGEPAPELQELQPIGIYTVPEISYCGKTEAELTQSSVPYEVGMAGYEVGMVRYRELTRGAIVGDSFGMLKPLVSTEDRTLLSVYVFGTNATDLVHIGQTIMVTVAQSTTSSTPSSTTSPSRGHTRWPRWRPRTRSAH